MNQFSTKYELNLPCSAMLNLAQHYVYKTRIHSGREDYFRIWQVSYRALGDRLSTAPDAKYIISGGNHAKGFSYSLQDIVNTSFDYA